MGDFVFYWGLHFWEVFFRLLYWVFWFVFFRVVSVLFGYFWGEFFN